MLNPPFYGRGILEQLLTLPKSNSSSSSSCCNYLVGWNGAITSILADNLLTKELIPSIERRLEALAPMLVRYIVHIPPVRAPTPQIKVWAPAPSPREAEKGREAELRRELLFGGGGGGNRLSLLHPILSRMSTSFPDPRLIQYDCGKLQTLDR